MDTSQTIPQTDMRLNRWLLAWAAVYQASHIAINVRGMYRMHSGMPLDFPVPPPIGGWTQELVSVWFGVAALDILGAFLTLACVAGYWKGSRGWRSTGLVGLSLWLYGMMLFNTITLRAGAWENANAFTYIGINLISIPLLILLGRLWKERPV